MDPVTYAISALARGLRRPHLARPGAPLEKEAVMTRKPRASRFLVALAACAALVSARGSLAQDDTVLFSTNVAPNVLMILDNSGSMNEIVWHPSFDPNATYSCANWSPTDTIFISGNTSVTACGRTRTLYHDNKTGFDTRYRGNYLNWLFSPAADAAYAEIQQGSNGFPSSCVGGAAYAKYQRSRFTAAKQAVKEIVCEVNLVKDVRFGLAVFRAPGSGAGNDPNGGFVVEPVDFYNSGQAADFDSALQSIDPDSWTPLGEMLFQAYTYFMSRTDSQRPFGKDGVTRFPKYSYRASSSGVGGEFTTSQFPDSPVQYACQKNFVILITDGEPTRDSFELKNPTNTTAGFADFVSKLIGDYSPDGEVEYQDDLICADCQSAFYLDDIALYMRQNDFRPDMDGDQLIDTYTVGFTTGSLANSLLQRTATNGNGIFFHANNAEQMRQAIVDAFIDIIEKSQSFTAATVPATRTAAGEKLYVSLFIPSAKTPYWEGHLRSYTITGGGEILDRFGNCALDDPSGQCFSGPFLPDAEPFWDAGAEIDDPASRSLYTTKIVGTAPALVPFTDALQATDLGVTYPPVVPYPFSTALNAEGLTDEIVANVRGCEFGTGVLTTDVSTPKACTNRYWLLGDIFHSNPIVVGAPALFVPEDSYKKFAQDFAKRDRVIYAGTNDGFFHGFLAGVWDDAATPAGYDAGTGEELFGFMPWTSRGVIENLPLDTGGRDYYFADGSATVSDVWLYSSATNANKLADGSEWRTVAISGMRQGGNQVFALDVTDPSGATYDYPGYMWEYPAENAPASLKATMGQTWSEPIITRVKLKVGGNNNAGAGFERWVAIFAGGYDATGDPNNPTAYSSSATAGRSIHIVDVKTGKTIAMKRFNATALPTDPESQMRYAIASTPAVYDLDFDGYADVIYVGDLGGNVWRWVIHAIGEDRANDGTGLVTQPAWPFRKFFDAPEWQATGSSPLHYKSFFYAPAATLRSGTLWLAFGSGERANLQFLPTTANIGDNNRFYVITDPDPMEASALPPVTVTETLLQNVTSASSATLAPGQRGYYLVAANGEKFVTNVDIFLYYVFAASFTPTVATDPCTIGGQSTLYVFKVYNAEGFFDDGSGTLDRTEDLGKGLPTDPRITVGTEGDSSNRVIVNKQGGEVLNFEAPPGFKAYGMYYWRELTE